MSKFKDLDKNVLAYQKAPSDELFELIYEDVKGMIIKSIPGGAKITQQDKDYIQVASIELLSALGRWNNTRNAKFSSYFGWYLKAAKVAYNKVYASGVVNNRYGKKANAPEIINLEMNNHMHHHLSFDAEIKKIEMNMDFDKMSPRLKDFELECIMLKMEGLTDAEIGRRLSKSRERVRQLLIDAVDVCNRRTRTSIIMNQKTIKAAKKRK